MAFFSDVEIKKRFKELFPYEKDGIDENRLQGSSYELTLGDEVFISSEKIAKKLTFEDEIVKIAPGDFAILITKEYIRIPGDMMAFISIKLKYKNMGLVNISGFHVDPGFRGCLTFSVYNAGPSTITIRRGDPVFLIFFTSLTDPAEKIYDGSRISQRQISTDDMIRISGISVSPYELEKRVGKLETIMKVYLPLLASFLTGLLIWALKFKGS